MSAAKRKKAEARERMMAHAQEYLTGSPEEIRWRKHRQAKARLQRYGEGRWSALPPELWPQAERELQAVLERRIEFGKPTPPEAMPHIIGGVITAIKLCGGRANFPGHVRRHNRRVKSYTGMVLRRIALGDLPAPQGMR